MQYGSAAAGIAPANYPSPPLREPELQGQFQVLMDSLNELEQNLDQAANRLYTKTSVLLGQVPPANAPAPETKQPDPNGLMQAMTWQARRMIRVTAAMHDQLNRIDQSGLGGS